MKLSELTRGESGTIVAISTDTVLKARFRSFGITKGASVKVIEQTLSKNTIEIKVHNTKIALRVSEADAIEIKI